MRIPNIRLLSFVLLLMGIMVPVASCVDERKDTEEYLEFDSGGEYHPSGCGAWNARLCGDGSLIVTHSVCGKLESRTAFTLTKSEARDLFSLFCAADIKRMKSSVRPGVPDEVRYTFALKDGSGTYNRLIWINDARENPAAMNLVAFLEALIEKYSGKKPIMR